MKSVAIALSVILSPSLLFAFDNTSDLKDFHRLGLPAVAEWNVSSTGFNLNWHVAQIKAGHRLIPSTYLPPYSTTGASNAKSASVATQYLTNFSSSFSYLSSSGLPLILRHDNLAMPITETCYRLPLVQSSVPASPLVWAIKSGALDDEKLCDPFGPLSEGSVWQREGAGLGGSLYLQTAQSLLPNPAFVIFAENNEAGYDRPQGVDNRAYCPIGPKRPDGVMSRKWVPADKLVTLNLRLKQYVDAVGYQSDPWQYWPVFYAYRGQQYATYFQAFRNQLSLGWQDRLYTAAYATSAETDYLPPKDVVDKIGPAPQGNIYDGSGPSAYVGGNLNSNFTSTAHLAKAKVNIEAWKWIRAKNPKAYRELFLWIGEQGALDGAIAKYHKPITPAMWGAYCEWHLWMAHEPGVPVLLHHWVKSTAKPTDKFFTSSSTTKLATLGVTSSMGGLTQNDYVKPIMQAVDHVSNDATLRKFWLNGSLVSGAWDATQRIWTVQTKLDNQVLVFVWTPCQLASSTIKVTVTGFGQVTFNLNGQISKSFVVSPAPKSGYTVQEIP